MHPRGLHAGKFVVVVGSCSFGPLRLCVCYGVIPLQDSVFVVSGPTGQVLLGIVKALKMDQALIFCRYDMIHRRMLSTLPASTAPLRCHGFVESPSHPSILGRMYN